MCLDKAHRLQKEDFMVILLTETKVNTYKLFFVEQLLPYSSLPVTEDMLFSETDTNLYIGDLFGSGTSEYLSRNSV